MVQKDYETLWDEETDQVGEILDEHVPDGYDVHNVIDTTEEYLQASEQAQNLMMGTEDIVELYRELDDLVTDEMVRLPTFEEGQQEDHQIPEYVITEAGEEFDNDSYAAAVAIGHTKHIYISDDDIFDAMEDAAEEWEDETVLNVDPWGETDEAYEQVTLGSV